MGIINTVMNNGGSNFTRITKSKLKGIHTLLKFTVEKYKEAVLNKESESVIHAWFETKEKVAQIQKQQFYTLAEKEFLNGVRRLYYTHKTVKKYDLDDDKVQPFAYPY